MKELIVYLIKSGICLSIFLLIYQLFLRRATFFRFNRMYLFIGLIISLIIPLFPYTYNIYIPTHGLLNTLSDSGTQDTNAVSDVDLWLIFGGIYLLGVLTLSIRSILSFRKIIQKIKSSEKVNHGSYKLIDSTNVDDPFSVLNYILLNTTKLSSTEKDLILKHEITHINQKHWIDLLCCEILLILQWFNPVAWIYVKIQKENHEFLADKAVIDAGISPALYRAVLINQQFQGPVFSFSNSFNYSKPLNRLIMITKTKSSPWKKITVLIVLPLFGIFIWASAKPNVVFVNNDFHVSTVPDKKKVSLNITYTGKVAKLESNADLSKYLILIDDKISTVEDTKNLKPSNTYVMGLIDGEEAIKTYGEKAKNGVVTITTVGDGLVLMGTNEEPIDNVLFIIDGRVSSKVEMNKLNPDDIDSIDVLKDKAAVKKYGEKGKNGVIIIKTKKKDK